jgi:hypothetical protein
MYDEREARQLCIRAINQFTKSQNISMQEKSEVEKMLGRFKSNSSINARDNGLCAALASYIKSLKAIEGFIISDSAFGGFDGSNPLLVALNKEIGLALDTKAQLCHDDLSKRQSRVDW